MIWAGRVVRADAGLPATDAVAKGRMRGNGTEQRGGCSSLRLVGDRATLLRPGWSQKPF